MGLLEARVAATGWRLESLPLDSALESRVRCSCWEMIDMELCRGGDETYGDESPEMLVRAIDRELGLAPAWRVEFRSGEPTWPKLDTREAAAFSSSSFCC
jgi:hypothetical protein